MDPQKNLQSGSEIEDALDLNELEAELFEKIEEVMVLQEKIYELKYGSRDIKSL